MNQNLAATPNDSWDFPKPGIFSVKTSVSSCSKTENRYKNQPDSSTFQEVNISLASVLQLSEVKTSHPFQRKSSKHVRNLYRVLDYPLHARQSSETDCVQFEAESSQENVIDWQKPQKDYCEKCKKYMLGTLKVLPRNQSRFEKLVSAVKTCCSPSVISGKMVRICVKCSSVLQQQYKW